jgi:hypothetical protein
MVHGLPVVHSSNITKPASAVAFHVRDDLIGRTYTVDREGTMAAKHALERALGDIVPIRIRGRYWWTLGMTWAAVDLIGLENLMLFMYGAEAGGKR